MTTQLEKQSQQQMPDWMSYDGSNDVLTIHGKRYSAAIFGEHGFLSPVGTLLRVEHSHNETVVLTTVQLAQHSDDMAVDRFAAAMKEKMARQRAKGRYGWDDKLVCPVGRLQKMLIDHISKGDPVDVGNFAMMLFNRTERTWPWAAESEAKPVQCDRCGMLEMEIKALEEKQ